MKNPLPNRLRRGFTLIELMVAMTITTMIVTILVSITAIALDTWTRSRSEVRANRQAKSMLDTMARDLEALVNRRGANTEWLSAISEPVENKNAAPAIDSPSAASLIFYTAPTDRYNGEVSDDDKTVGDISCVGYQLKFQDPIQAPGSKEIPTFVLYRNLADPDVTYKELLSKSNRTASSLRSLFNDSFGSKNDDANNFVCENIFQFSITLNIRVERSFARGASTVEIPITLGGPEASATEFRLEAGNIITDFSARNTEVSDLEIKHGSLTSVEVSMTVLTDFAVDQMRNRTFKTPTEQSEFLTKNSYQYSKLVPVATP